MRRIPPFSLDDLEKLVDSVEKPQVRWDTVLARSDRDSHCRSRIEHNVGSEEELQNTDVDGATAGPSGHRCRLGVRV
jgi:hypothetical protein